MSMMRDLARHRGFRVDVGLVTGQQLRGTIESVSTGENDLSDCSSILLRPAKNDTPFAIAVPHIVYARVVDEANSIQQPPRTIQGRM